MEEVERRALMAAVENRRKGQSFEDSLAINVRKEGLGYEAYIDLIGRVRETSKRRKIDMPDAALQMVSE
jgi:hypothetical protein